MATRKRKFAPISEEQMQEKQRKLKNKSTLSKEEVAGNQFQSYLEYMGETDVNYMEYSVEKLNKYLSTFWFSVRTDSGDLYCLKTLEGLRYSINRLLKRKGAQFDICSRASEGFVTSNLAFEAAKKELKQEGKGVVKHIPDIAPERKCKLVKHDKILAYTMLEHFCHIVTMLRTKLS